MEKPTWILETGGDITGSSTPAVGEPEEKQRWKTLGQGFVGEHEESYLQIDPSI